MSEYPCEHELIELTNWDIIKTGVKPLVERVREMWKYGDDYTYLRKGRDKLYKKPCMKWELHTMGWSGNESIIGALRQNYLFWSMCWEQSNAGGHYRFEIKMDMWEKSNKKT